MFLIKNLIRKGFNPSLLSTTEHIGEIVRISSILINGLKFESLECSYVLR